jgi:hypothetical protein
LTCPAPPTGCGAFASSTCLRPAGAPVGEREILGLNGDTACDGSQLIARCELNEGSDGSLRLTLVASVEDFAFELRATGLAADGSAIENSCHVTVVEDQASYGGQVLGTCGLGPPTLAQPCRLSNIELGEIEGVDVSFNVECNSLRSDVTGDGFDVDGRIQFARCEGF